MVSAHAGLAAPARGIGFARAPKPDPRTPRPGSAALPIRSLLLLVALLLPAAAAAQSGDAAQTPAEVMARRAYDVRETHCATAAGQSDPVRTAEAVVNAAPVYLEVAREYARSGDSFLLYWQAVLSQCLGQDQRAFLDYRSFLRDGKNEEAYPALVDDARRRLRVMRLQGRTPGGAAFQRINPRRSGPAILRVGLGGGYALLAGGGETFHYGALAVDASIRLAGPLRLWIVARPGVSGPNEAGESGLKTVSILAPAGLGLQLSVPLAVRPTFGAAFEITGAQRLVDGALKLVPVAGATGQVALELPLGQSAVSIRPAGEFGFLGRHFLARGLLQVVIET